MLVATEPAIPLWTWVFFALVLVVVVMVMGVAARRLGAGRGPARRVRGLTSEQRAFQDEMRLMLEVRLRERQAGGPVEGPVDGSAGGEAGERC